MTATVSETAAPRSRTRNAPETEVTVDAAALAALIRVVQTVTWDLARIIGRGDYSPNATLVRMGAHREDVETIKAFLNSQPRPSWIPGPEDE